jgi:cytochrome c-type biogenesis protein CcmE
VKGLLASRRSRLIAILLVSTAAISILAVNAAGSSLSYYVTPEEFAQQLDTDGRRWRVGGRVVPDTIVERDGRPYQWEIVGDHGERLIVVYEEGPVPGLFGANTFVIVDGETAAADPNQANVDAPPTLVASSLVIKHEDEMVVETPASSPGAAPYAPTENR